MERTDTLSERYELGKLIGRGGMADVYQATDRVLDRQVAVKVLRELTENESDRERFIAEAKTLAKLNHPGLVTVLDAGTHGDHPFLVMQLIDGPNLAENSANSALNATEVIEVGSQVADALAHAHDMGVVHRDVKPSNIMLGKDGRVWLTDFGIARLLGDTGGHTRTGMTVGSPAYLSPEQVRGQQVSPAADIYSLGLVLIEMFSGKRAYPQASTEAALARLTSPPRIPEEVSQGWRSLLTAMTSLHPDARPIAQQVATTLRGLAADHNETPEATQAMVQEADSTRLLPQSTTTLAPTPAPTVQKLERRRLAAIVAAVVIVLILAIALLSSLGADAGDSPSPGIDDPAGVPAELEQPTDEPSTEDDVPIEEVPGGEDTSKEEKKRQRELNKERKKREREQKKQNKGRGNG